MKRINSVSDMPKSFSLSKYDGLNSLSDKDFLGSYIGKGILILLIIMKIKSMVFVMELIYRLVIMMILS